MNRLQKLQIARMAYKDINQSIEKWQRPELCGNDLPILCHWDGCITVDDELFHERELRKGLDEVF